MVYLGVVAILILASVNTGNNLLFMVLACSIAGILISGVLSRAVLTGLELRFDMPEHVFAEQPVVAELELRNEKPAWPSFSLRVVGENKKGAGEILTRPVFFPYIPRAILRAPESRADISASRQLSAGRFQHPHALPFRLLRKNPPGGFANGDHRLSQVAPTDHFYEVLPLLSGEMASNFRGRGHELHSLRDYLSSDSARFVDWKVTARAGRLMVREFAREDERRVMLVL